MRNNICEYLYSELFGYIYTLNIGYWPHSVIFAWNIVSLIKWLFAIYMSVLESSSFPKEYQISYL